MKHTEGEWPIELDNADERSGGEWYQVGPAKIPFPYNATKERREEAKGYANLIASARPLLQACKDARNVLIFIALLITTETKLPELIARLDNVINQAEGE